MLLNEPQSVHQSCLRSPAEHIYIWTTRTTGQSIVVCTPKSTHAKTLHCCQSARLFGCEIGTIVNIPSMSTMPETRIYQNVTRVKPYGQTVYGYSTRLAVSVGNSQILHSIQLCNAACIAHSKLLT